MGIGNCWFTCTLVAIGSIFIIQFIGDNFNLAVDPVNKKMVKKIKRNLSIEHNPITTICGFICFFYSLFLMAFPLLYETKSEIDIYYSVGIGMFGICLLVIPDDIKSALIFFVKKKSE